MLTRMSMFVLSYVDDRDKFVAIDENSGGYPYEVDLKQARFWDSRERVEEYMSHFPGKFVLEMVTFNLVNR